MWAVELIPLIRVGGVTKKPGGKIIWKCAFLRQFETFEGVKDKGSEIGRDRGREKRIIFLCSG